MQIWAGIREIISNMLGINTVSSILGTMYNLYPLENNLMMEAIEEWGLMYQDKAEWLHEPDSGNPVYIASLGLPAFISSEKTRMALLEFESEITAPKLVKEEVNPNYFPPTTDKFGNVKVSGQSQTIYKEETIGTTERAEYMNEEYQRKVVGRLRNQIEYGVAKGSMIIKPYVRRVKEQLVAGVEDENAPDKYIMEFDFIQADCFYPLAFSEDVLTEVAFVQTKEDKGVTYTRLEHHKLIGNRVEITNKAFMSNSNTLVANITGANFGKEISLSSVPEWKDIPEKAVVCNVDRMLFGYFKMPMANTIDTKSPMGMSVFGRARTLIRDADMQYSRLLWEFEGGQLAIDIDRDAMGFMNDTEGGTHRVMSQLQNRLYRQIDLGESDTYKPFSPQLRDSSLINGLNTILMKIEDVCELSHGTLSDVAAEARTATEIKILRQRSYSSVQEIQKALQRALDGVIYTMDVYCTLYNIVGDVVKDENGKVDMKKLGRYEVSYDWDDSIIVDKDTELQKNMQLLSAGLKSKVEVRSWSEGETKQQAAEALERIARENQEAIERNMMVSSQMGKQINGGNDKESSKTGNETTKEGSDEEETKVVGQKPSQQEQMQNLSQNGTV